MTKIENKKAESQKQNQETEFEEQAGEESKKQHMKWRVTCFDSTIWKAMACPLHDARLKIYGWRSWWAAESWGS